jgi:hypothetical protein
LEKPYAMTPKASPNIARPEMPFFGSCRLKSSRGNRSAMIAARTAQSGQSARAERGRGQRANDSDLGQERISPGLMRAHGRQVNEP